MATRLECTEGGSSKFWEGAVEGKTLTARWGKIGTDGQTKSKDFASPAAAEAELEKLVREKRGKGYVEAGGAPPAKPPPAQAKGGSEPKPTHRCTTDAGIVALFDAAHFTSIVDQAAWEAELLEDADIRRHIQAGHLVPLSAGSDGRFEVAVRVGELTAEEQKALTDRSPQPYLLAVDRGATVGGLEFVHAAPDAKHAFAAGVPKGRWAVTVCALEGKKMPDVVALLAPAKDGQTFRDEIAPFDPKPKVAPTPGAPIRTLKQAGEVARAGDAARAAAALEQMIAKKPDVAAFAALAEIRAYEHAWPAFF
ncbi:MAG TPA: WGR domain-containing protein, partial [Minicystis sp.]|nr:WGR domain-containing protein [Minicystis sp.]